jgi:hypothetical protein
MAAASRFSRRPMPLKTQLAETGRRFRALFRWQRLIGLGVTGLIFYGVVFGLLGRTHVGWTRSPSASHFSWPALPHFTVWKKPAPGGGEETIYTVPSRQLTTREMAQLGATTNAASVPTAAR